jgi:hypothetical protein
METLSGDQRLITNSSLPVVEIRPSKAGKLIAFVALDILLTGACVGMLFIPAGEIFGLVGILFFGVGGAYAVWRMSRHRGPTFVLGPDGLTFCMVPGHARIPWSDVEAAGVMRVASTEMAAIRLKRYDGYLSSLTPEGAAQAARGGWIMKASAIAVGHLVQENSLLDFAERRGLAESMAWNRENFGFDIGFSWGQLDRSKDEFVVLLQGYIQRYGAEKADGA